MPRSRHRIAEGGEAKHSWDRHPREGNYAWSAFVTYRDLGPQNRSYRRVAEIHGKTEGTIAQFAHRWDWRRRIIEFDRWVDEKSQIAEVEAVKEMRARHIKIAMSLQGAGAIALNKLIESERSGKTRVLKPTELREMIDLGVKLERLNRGEPTDLTRSELDMRSKPASEMTEAELDAEIARERSRLEKEKAG